MEKAKAMGVPVDLYVDVCIIANEKKTNMTQPHGTHDIGTMFTFKDRFVHVCKSARNWLVKTSLENKT